MPRAPPGFRAARVPKAGAKGAAGRNGDRPRMGSGRHERQIVILGHAFDLPAAPPGWDEASRPPIRIVDPMGGAVAWLPPDVGAICVGFAVRDALAAGD